MTIKYLVARLKYLRFHLPTRHMVQLWSSYIKPHLTYTAYVLKLEHRKTRLNKFDKLYCWSFRKMVGAPIYSPNTLL